MTGRSIRATPIVPVVDGYVAGACNIGAWEIRRRRAAAIAAFAAALGMLAILVAVGAPGWVRIALFLPFWGGMISWLQARRRFCVGYAMSGVSNFASNEAGRQAIVDPAQRAADRRATVVLIRDAFLLAIVPTVIAVALPL